MNTLFQSSSLPETAQILCDEWGLAVIPLCPCGKTPLVSWANYQAVCPSSEQVEAWWQEYFDANIGLICGPHSDLLVLDCDTVEAQKWAKKHIIQSPLCVMTSRGYHLYYRWPKNMSISELKELKSALKAQNMGLDLQISGCYVVGPQSIHPSGAIYTMHDYFGDSWLDDEVPEFMELKEDTQNVDLSSLDLSEVRSRFSVIDHGDRNNAMTQYVGSLVAMGGSYPDVLREALEENNSRFNPPMAPKEVRTIVESVFKTHERNHGTQATKSNEPQIDTSDLRPVKVEVKAFKPWPEHLLHPGGLLEEIIDYTMDSSMRTERSFALAGAVSLLGTVLSQRVVTTSDLPTSLYTIVVGDSGSGKDAPRSVISRLLRCDTSLARAYAGNDMASNASIISYLNREGCQRAIFILDEIGMFLKQTKNPNSAKNGIIKTLTDMYGKKANDPYRKPYLNEENDKYVEWYGLSIFGSSVPDEFWESLQDNETTNGFLARCMIFQQESEFCMPDFSRQDKGIPPSLQKSIIDLWNIDGGEGNPDFVNGGYTLRSIAKPHRIPLSPEASQYHMKRATEIEYKKEEMRRSGDKMALSIYCRSVAKAWAVSLIHCASRIGTKIVHSQIELEDIEWAWDLVDECDTRMIEQGEQNIAQSRFQALCQKIMNVIMRRSIECQQKQIEPVGANFRDVSRNIRTENRKDLMIAIETLMAQGKLCETKNRAKNGREVTVYQVAEIVEE